jgi:16S rRNA (uracil1498-N3)-methyltransferase
MTRLLLDKNLETPGEVHVSGDEFHYLVHVRRHRLEDEIEIRDYEGRRFLGVVKQIERDRVVLSLEKELPEVQIIWPVTLILAVPKRSVFGDVVRQTSEIGIQRLIPVSTERSIAKPGANKLERWRRIAQESLRQCGRAKPLIVDDMTGFADAAKELGAHGKALLLHPDSTEETTPLLGSAEKQTGPISIAIGPEGGFTDNETMMAVACGFQPVSLGTPIMRIETAAIVAAVLGISLLGGL